MDVKPQATFFNVVQGTSEGDGPLARVIAPRGFAAAPTLLLLAQPRGQATPEQARVFLDVVLGTFQRSPGSITSRLISALQVARRQVLSLEEDADIDAFCAVVTVEEVYLASTGETHAYLLSGTSGRRQGERIDFPELPEGGDSQGGVHLFRFEPAVEEALLVMTEEVARDAELAGLPSHASSPPSSLVRELWQESRGETLAAAICFTFGHGRPQVTDLAQEGGRWAPSRGRQAVTGASTRAARARRWFTPHWMGRQMASLPRRPWRQRLRPFLILLLLVAVAAAAVTAAIKVPPFLEERAATHRERLVDEAQAAFSQAEGAETKSERREQLNKALALLDEARGDGTLPERAIELRAQVDKALVALDARQQLADWQVIVETPYDPLATPRLRQLAFGGGQAYLLDQQRGTVYGYQIVKTEAGELVPQLIAAGPSAAGAISIRLVGGVDPADPGEEATVLLLDEQHRLFAMEPDGALRELALRDADELESLTAVASQEGRLYLLDALDGQVWRYNPTDQGYDSERRSVAASRAMTDAVDLAVHDAVFVLTRSGSIHKFLAGKPQPFAQDGLDRPLLQPAAIFYDRAGDLLYVADTGNDRIVVFDPAGTFQRQYVAPELVGVRGVAVDASQAVLYVLARERLLATELPP